MTQPIVATLRVRTPNQPELLVPLHDGSNLQVGRDPSNEIVLDDPAVSRVHAVFNASQTKLSVTDLSSRNGTMVNGEPIFFITPLKHGDQVNLGLTRISVEQEAPMAISSSFNRLRSFTIDLEPVNVLMLTASVRNFAALQSRGSADETRVALANWQSSIKKSVIAGGGSIEECLGHNIVALWPDDDDERSAEKVLKTALDVFDFAERQLPGLRGAAAESESAPLVLLGSARGMRSCRDSRTENPRLLLLPSPDFDAFYLMSFLERAIPKRGWFLVLTEGLRQRLAARLTLPAEGKLHCRDGAQELALFKWQAEKTQL